MKKIQILSIALITIFASCTTTEENIWFIKSATFCAEAWHNESWTTQQQDVNAKTWLEMQGVTVLASEYDPGSTTAQPCNACSCLSGGVHRIQTDAEFTDIMVNEGFVLE